MRVADRMSQAAGALRRARMHHLLSETIEHPNRGSFLSFPGHVVQPADQRSGEARVHPGCIIVVTPLAPATNTTDAMPMNRPCSTTPGMALIAALSAAASAIMGKRQSRIALPS